MSSPPPASPLVLVLDSGSPLVSVALGHASDAGDLLASRSVEIAQSSRQLLEMVAQVLEEAGATPRDLGGVAALRGPGSFTGLRIGLATVLGLHQALGVPATAVSTLETLAAAALAELPGSTTVIAAVDALRGDWSAQAFAPGPFPRPLTEVELLPGAELPRLAGGAPVLDVLITGFGVTRLAELPGWPNGARLHEAGPLAAAALRLVSAPHFVWDPDLLTSPLYSRPPAVSVPRLRTVRTVRTARTATMVRPS
jgi:tRNA threonylcarbamoyl adenosine modification protein YeaZ